MDKANNANIPSTSKIWEIMSDDYLKVGRQLAAITGGLVPGAVLSYIIYLHNANTEELFKEIEGKKYRKISHSDIQTGCMIGRKQAINALNNLKKSGFIESIKARYNKKHCMYLWVNCPKISEMIAPNKSHIVTIPEHAQKGFSESAQKGFSESTLTALSKNKNNKEKNNNKKGENADFLKINGKPVSDEEIIRSIAHRVIMDKAPYRRYLNAANNDPAFLQREAENFASFYLDKHRDDETASIRFARWMNQPNQASRMFANWIKNKRNTGNFGKMADTVPYKTPTQGNWG